MPVVVFTGRELSAEEDAQLHTMARSIVVKGVESPERLLDETALFLHRVITDLPTDKQRMLERLNSSDEDLVDRTVLLVDDDAHNIFALSSVLERRGMKVLTATTGSEAITILDSESDPAIVLMDIMMPEMDGYQTIAKIRENPVFRRLPIVALTAKAMKGDREKCLEAGASDYLALTERFDTLFLEGVPVLVPDRKEAARRFGIHRKRALHSALSFYRASRRRHSWKRRQDRPPCHLI